MGGSDVRPGGGDEREGPAQEGRRQLGLGSPGCFLLSPCGTRSTLRRCPEPSVKPELPGAEAEAGLDGRNGPPLRNGFNFSNQPHLLG